MHFSIDYERSDFIDRMAIDFVNHPPGPVHAPSSRVRDDLKSLQIWCEQTLRKIAARFVSQVSPFGKDDDYSPKESLGLIFDSNDTLLLFCQVLSNYPKPLEDRAFVTLEYLLAGNVSLYWLQGRFLDEAQGYSNKCVANALLIAADINLHNSNSVCRRQFLDFNAVRHVSQYGMEVGRTIYPPKSSHSDEMAEWVAQILLRCAYWGARGFPKNAETVQQWAETSFDSLDTYRLFLSGLKTFPSPVFELVVSAFLKLGVDQSAVAPSLGLISVPFGAKVLSRAISECFIAK